MAIYAIALQPPGSSGTAETNFRNFRKRYANQGAIRETALLSSCAPVGQAGQVLRSG
jgi:hypothetical protein